MSTARLAGTGRPEEDIELAGAPADPLRRCPAAGINENDLVNAECGGELLGNTNKVSFDAVVRFARPRFHAYGRRYWRGGRSRAVSGTLKTEYLDAFVLRLVDLVDRRTKRHKRLRQVDIVKDNTLLPSDLERGDRNLRVAQTLLVISSFTH